MFKYNYPKELSISIYSIIGNRLYKNRLKMQQLFSILKGLYNPENPRLYD